MNTPCSQLRVKKLGRADRRRPDHSAWISACDQGDSTLEVEGRSRSRGTSRWMSPATTFKGYRSFRHCFTLFTEYFAPFDHSTSALSVPVAILRLSGNPPARDSCCTIKQHYSKGATGAGGRANIGSASRTVTGLVTLFHLHHSRFRKIVGPEITTSMPGSPQSNNPQRSVKSSREAQVVQGRPE